MSSIHPGFGSVPIANSLAGVSSAGKNSSVEQSIRADGSAAKVADAAHAHAGGLMGSEKSGDRDADGRQLYDQSAGTSRTVAGNDEAKHPLPRSKDPDKGRGTRLDFDA